MKKLLVPIMLVALTAGMIMHYGVRDFFMPPAVRRSRSLSLQELQQKAREAEERFNKKKEDAASVAMAYMNLGRRQVEEEQWNPAISSLGKSVKYGRDSSRLYYYLGLAYANRGKESGSSDDIDAAIQFYRAALEKQPDFNDARYGLAMVLYLIKNQGDQAIPHLVAILKDDPLFHPASFALGRIYYEKGDLQRALSVYESLCDILEERGSFDMKETYEEKCRSNRNRILREMTAK